MSKVLNALDVSEQNHHASIHTPFYSPQAMASAPAKASKMAIAVLIAVPAVLTAGWSGFQSYQDKRLQWLSTNQAQVVTQEVPFEYRELPYPKFDHLTSTSDLDMPYAETLQVPVVVQVTKSAVKEPAIEPMPESSSEPFLDQLDLSGLSPELALRVESALGNEQLRPNTESNSALSDLAQQSEKWYGKLPALNFQTHVYSSNPTKRWVKVNGVEYEEGDWISDRIKLEAIEQQSCQIRFDGELIEVPALYDWKG